jgi:hypothetical protein
VIAVEIIFVRPLSRRRQETWNAALRFARDGVVAIRAALIAPCRAAARERAAKETMFFERLRGGPTTVELLDLDVSAITNGGACPSRLSTKDYL